MFAGCGHQKQSLEELVSEGNVEAISELIRDLDSTKKAEIEAVQAKFEAKRKPIKAAIFQAMKKGGK